MSFDLLSRLDEPRFRSWVQAGLAVAVPGAVLGGLMLAGADEHGEIHLAIFGFMFALLAGCAFSGLALLSSLTGLLAVRAPRPAWRYLEPWLLGLPFVALVLLIVSGGAVQFFH